VTDVTALDMLRTSLRHVLTEDSQQPLATRLDQLGWADVVAGDPSTALRTLFEIKGETVSSADALGPELARLLADITGDETLASTVVGLESPYGASTLNVDLLDVDVITFSPVSSRRVAVPVGSRLALCSAGALSSQALAGTDETLGGERLTGSVPIDAVTWIDGDAHDRIVAHGRWLVACELVGIGRHVIGSAVAYTAERVQYGKPIGVFQALQHRLASAHSMIVGAGHLVEQAGDRDQWTAIVAKCMAGQAAEFACVQAQQCYGAIGFTWEHEFHRYLRRTYVLDSLFGDWRTLEHEIGTRLQSTGVVPKIGSL
jgi:Acyl-CoA dehydrogenase, C-terminal domain